MDVVFYVTPIPVDNASCAVNGSISSPCYQLQMLNWTLLSNKASVLLYLLPGVHTMPNPHVFKAFNVTRFVISPFFEEDTGRINCEEQTELLFQQMQFLTILSVDFTSCGLNVTQLEGSQYESNTAVNIINCMFINNTLNYSVSIINVNLVLIMNCGFYSNGGALSCVMTDHTQLLTDLTVARTVFVDNHREGHCGTLYCQSVELVVDRSKFISNTATSGGAICSHSSSVHISSSSFLHNLANDSGGAIYMLLSNLVISHSYFFQNHAADSGGAVFLSRSRPEIGSSSLKNNSAGRTGGAIYVERIPQDDLLYVTNTIFSFNKAGLSGGVIHCRYTSKAPLYFAGGLSEFNSAGKGGFAYVLNCFLVVVEYTVANNRALSNGGAVHSDDSIVHMKTPCTMSHNTAQGNGGALYLLNSNIFIGNKSHLIFSNNSAAKGGAIYVSDDECDQHILDPGNTCFLYNDKNSRKLLVFSNNTADGGSVLYGGLLDRCQPRVRGDLEPLGTALRNFKNYSQYKQTPLAITSDTVKLCLCLDESLPNNCMQNSSFTKMRGETVTLTIAGLDQDANPIPAIIKAAYMEISAQVGEGEGRTEISNKCHQVDFHVYAESSPATLVLAPEGPCGESSLSTITIGITVAPCSTGFEQDKNRCTCDRRLNGYTTNCDINTRSFKRKGSIWFRYDKQYLKVYKNCPLDYCNTSDDSISISNPDSQCAHHRSGVLCGACQHNYSIALGGSRCLQCTSKYTFAWLIVVFAVAGIALVTLLLVCNVTISAGTLNGLIFYANVVSTSGLTSLRNCSIHPILSIFIAWVNLDLGIETCFYSGMDTYLKTWLQFVFPLYIWLLVVAIIIASYYSSTAMKIFGRNNIAILATLFLLSYSKFLKTIVTVLTFTQVLVGRADNVTDQLLPYKVWTYDGNIEYLKGRHIVLFVVAFLFLLVLFLPYTLALIFGQCLRSMSVRRGLRWMHSAPFISILDAYHAPYNRKHRYWTGLVLLTRCIMYPVFCINYEVLTNMYTLTLVITGILTIKTFSTRIYRQFLNNLLEDGFLLNLVVLSVSLHYLKGKESAENSLCNSITASLSVSFVMFICILLLHSYHQIKKTRCYVSVQNFILKLARIKSAQGLQSHTLLEEENSEVCLGISENPIIPTTTILDLNTDTN